MKLLLLIEMLNSSGGHHARRCNSCRWLRFPCCGQRFPCDLCHEEATDGHEMKWAHRMVRLLGAAGLRVTAGRYTEDIRPGLVCAVHWPCKDGGGHSHLPLAQCSSETGY